MWGDPEWSYTYVMVTPNLPVSNSLMQLNRFAGKSTLTTWRGRVIGKKRVARVVCGGHGRHNLPWLDPTLQGLPFDEILWLDEVETRVVFQVDRRSATGWRTVENVLDEFSWHEGAIPGKSRYRVALSSWNCTGNPSSALALAFRKWRLQRPPWRSASS